MTQVTLKTIEQNDNVGMFSICFDGNSESEFEKFLMEFKDNATYNKDFNAILLALSKIIDKGALERFFRIEGRMNDHVSALSIDSRKLRLYCLRISDQILILGNGGVFSGCSFFHCFQHWQISGLSSFTATKAKRLFFLRVPLL